ncbi:DUF6716 putative glycosyltransferase [Streptomyces peucetius]|uniref:Uncharacterized protein n=1 Tax=Streptomyces peucetius TaxID=1950 RepID=A0ABY6IAM6_STRPE|nr:DUF6716 putative glycosyltransferase [Streptomyces peucetius]UYQ64013.1 hypothetical protein OGH68_22790 [Streptomyces peucetius]
MPTRSSEAVRIAVLADSDTRWKWGALTARRIAPSTSVELSGFLLRGRATPTARQLAEVGVRADDLREVTGNEFLRAMKDEAYDVVVLALVGGGVQAMLHGLAALGLERRPVVVTGYVGVVYEKLSDGLLLRHGADVVLANSRHDAERFRAVYEGVGADASCVTEAALPFLGGAPYRAEAGRDTVVFAVQPSVPESRADRTYLLRRLVEHARLHPGREVLLKLRSKPGEHTTHLEELPYQKLVEKLPGGLPSNFRLVYGHMGEVLDRTDLLVTVSSTAALEALHRRIPTAVLTDLGVREALGNHHFLGSGLLASWDQLDGGLRPAPDAEWLARQGVAAGGPPTPPSGSPHACQGVGGVGGGSYEAAFDEARKRVAELLLVPALPAPAPYYTPTTAPGYLPALLARHHLAPDGTPLAGAAPKAEVTGVRRVVRDAVREVARGAYRHGVQRVAPVIRRMGEL